MFPSFFFHTHFPLQCTATRVIYNKFSQKRITFRISRSPNHIFPTGYGPSTRSVNESVCEKKNRKVPLSTSRLARDTKHNNAIACFPTLHLPLKQDSFLSTSNLCVKISWWHNWFKKCDKIWRHKFSIVEVSNEDGKRPHGHASWTEKCWKSQQKTTHHGMPKMPRQCAFYHPQ